MGGFLQENSRHVSRPAALPRASGRGRGAAGRLFFAINHGGRLRFAFCRSGPIPFAFPGQYGILHHVFRWGWIPYVSHLSGGL